MTVDNTNANTTILSDKIFNKERFANIEIANSTHAIGIKMLKDKYPKTVNNDFSSTNAHTTINKYELIFIIWFAIGVVASPGIAANAVDVAAAVVTAITIAFSHQ